MDKFDLNKTVIATFPHFQTLLVLPMDYDGGTLLRKCQCRRLANARAGARYDHNFATEAFHQGENVGAGQGPDQTVFDTTLQLLAHHFVLLRG
jgi:hypothetical protein